MASSQQLILGVGAGGVVQYKIERSLRFNRDDGAYLNRTPGSTGNRTIWTWSSWVKLSVFDMNRVLFSAVTGSNETVLYFDSVGRIDFYDYQSSVYTGRLQTTQLFRDPGAWYHVVAVWDSANATAGNRMRLYINGSEVTAFNIDTNPTQNLNSVWNQTIEHRVGGYSAGSIPWNGYMADVNFIDGQALTPSSFGETNADTGVWQPKAYSGTYGTNGFQLLFADNSGTTSTTLGKDTSGNGNNWTPNNFSVTAGAGNDSLVDTPTPYGTDTGAGGEVRGNYCTLNPLKGFGTISNGNLDLANATVAYVTTIAFPQSGKWYCEFSTPGNTSSTGCGVFVRPMNSLLTALGDLNDYNTTYYRNDNALIENGVAAATYSAWTSGANVIGVALDMDAKTVRYYLNGVAQGTAARNLLSTTSDYTAAFYNYGSGQVLSCNYGQRPFAYTAPSGFKALCTQNLPTPTIGATSTTQAGKYFNAVLYTGNGSTQSITGVGFQPDFNWIKVRNDTSWHNLVDAVRGVDKNLYSNNTNAEATVSRVTSFNSDGFSLSSSNDTNYLNNTYVAWNWKANGAGSSNTQGTITSTVSANTTAGFSIVTYTGTGANATVGHGLGATPGMIIIKNRDYGYNWAVWHTSLGGGDYALQLNNTNAKTNAYDYWNGDPTSTVFTLGTDAGSNQSLLTYVAYCFAPVAGYSAFGTYEGNNSADGPFVYLGFMPRYLLIKSSTLNGYEWTILDTARTPYNVMNGYLIANGANAQATGFNQIDIVSNGFKIRQAAGNINPSGGTLIYAAFAENPFKYSLAR